MKYENFEKVKELIYQIQKAEVELANFSDETLHLDVMVDSRIFKKIGSYGDYSENLARFIDEIKADLKIRIQKLKDELSEL